MLLQEIQHYKRFHPELTEILQEKIMLFIDINGNSVLQQGAIVKVELLLDANNIK